MTHLRRKMARDLWQMKWRALAIVMTIASGVAVYGGFHMGVSSLFWTRDSVFRELHFADLEVRFLPDDTHNLPSLDAIDGVAQVERRLLFPGTIRLPSGLPLAVVMTNLERPAPDIHAFEVIAGRTFRPDELDAVVIDASLARYHGYRVGDTLDVKVGRAVYHRRVVGVVITPEYFVSTSNPSYFVPQRGSLGFVFGNLAAISDSLGFTFVNDLVFRFAPDADPALVKQRILGRLGKLAIEQVTPWDRHFSYHYIQMQLESIQTFVPAMVAVLLVLTFIVTFVNVNRMVAVERREIGALMALGHGSARLLRAYLAAGLALGLVGSLLGLALSLGIRDIFTTACGRALGMPEVRTIVDVPAALRGVGYEVAVALVATLLPVLRLLRLPVQQVIREMPAPLSDRRLRSLRRIGALVGRLPITYRYAARSLARQRARALVTVVSIAVALGVATAYRLSLASLDTTLGRWLKNDNWDLAVDFLYPVPLERARSLGALPSVRQSLPYVGCYVGLHAGRRVGDATLFGTDLDSPMIDIRVVEGRRPRPGPEREAILTRELARQLGLGVGDLFEVEAMAERYPIRLVGLSWAAVSGLTVVPFAMAQDICQSPEMASGTYLETAGDARDDAGRARDLEFVGKVLPKGDLMAQIRDALSGLTVVLDLATTVSLFVAVLVILTSINLSVLENERDFATLRALGYGRGLIASAILVEAAFYAVGAVLLGIPIAAGLSVYLNGQLGAAWFQVQNSFLPSAFAKVLAPALVLIPVGCYPGIRHVLSEVSLASIRSRLLE